MRAQAEVPSARRTDTPRAIRHAASRSPVTSTGVSISTCGGAKPDLARWGPASFARLADLLDRAVDRGVVVELTLFCPSYEDSRRRLSPLNEANNVSGVGRAARDAVYDRLQNGGLQAVQEAPVRKLAGALSRTSGA